MWLHSSIEQWEHIDKEEPFSYAFSTPQDHRSDTDSSDELSSSTSSPPLSLRDIVVDPDEDFDLSMSHTRSHEQLRRDFDSLDFGATLANDYLAERHDVGRVGSTSNVSRQQRIQENHPYRRPDRARGALMFPAPHNDHDIGAGSQYGANSLDTIYLPSSEDEQLDHLPKVPRSPTPAPVALPPSAFYGPHTFPDAGPRLREALNLPPGAHVSLWSVIEPADPETRPGVPYPMLMQLAIYGSERKSLTLQGIYEAIATRFRYFRREDVMGRDSWRSSVRHALSLYSVFVKVPRPKTVPGKGCSWVLNIAATKQYGRLRKRNTANRKNEKKNNAESERGSRNKVSDAQTRRPSNRSKATTRIARGVYEDTSDSTSVSDSLYPSFGQGAYVSDSDTMSDATSISPFDESNLQPAFHEGAHLSFPSSVSSLTTEVSSNDYATRVSNGLRSRSGASRRAQEPVSSSKRGRRTCVSD